MCVRCFANGGGSMVRPVVFSGVLNLSHLDLDKRMADGVGFPRVNGDVSAVNNTSIGITLNLSMMNSYRVPGQFNPVWYEYSRHDNATCRLRLMHPTHIQTTTCR
eukprot:m.161297 g.161297  ORF g.161297 m.161297 type:complete len:105 (+) comp31224_c0_seq3:1073-1387(+)